MTRGKCCVGGCSSWGGVAPADEPRGTHATGGLTAAAARGAATVALAAPPAGTPAAPPAAPPVATFASRAVSDVSGGVAAVTPLCALVAASTATAVTSPSGNDGSVSATGHRVHADEDKAVAMGAPMPSGGTKRHRSAPATASSTSDKPSTSGGRNKRASLVKEENRVVRICGHRPFVPRASSTTQAGTLTTQPEVQVPHVHGVSLPLCRRSGCAATAST